MAHWLHISSMWGYLSPINKLVNLIEWHGHDLTLRKNPSKEERRKKSGYGAFVSNRLDYCNALLLDCLLENKQSQGFSSSITYCITPVLKSLQWLPVQYRHNLKILLIVYKALSGLALAWSLITTRSNLDRSSCFGFSSLTQKKIQSFW